MFKFLLLRKTKEGPLGLLLFYGEDRSATSKSARGRNAVSFFERHHVPFGNPACRVTCETVQISAGLYFFCYGVLKNTL